MFDNSIFDVVIGLLFVFFVFSLVVSGINEGVRKLLNTRSKALWVAVQRILDESDSAPQTTSLSPALGPVPDRTDVSSNPRTVVGSEPAESLARQLYDHPVIARLDTARLGRPTRINDIPPREFARALVDILTPDDPDGNPLWDGIEERIRELPGPLRTQFQLLYREADGDVLRFRLAVETWFDSSMERVSSWYRSRTRIVMVLYGLAVAVFFNVSAIGVTTELYRNDVVRDTVVSLAETNATGLGGIEDCTTRTCVEAEVSSVLDTGLPIWWRTCPGIGTDSGDHWCGFEDFGSSLATVAGWLITAAALSIGASFWFGLLKRAVRIRSQPGGSSG